MQIAKLSGRVLLFSVAFGALFAGCNREKADGNVLAKVNGYTISRGEFEKNYKLQMAQQKQPLTPPEDQALRLSVLRKLIDVQLQLQRAKKLGIGASEEDVRSKFEQAKAPYTKEEFEKQLSLMGFTEAEYKEELGRSLTIEKLLNQEVASKVTISDADIQGYYDQHKSDFNVPEAQYYISHIYTQAMNSIQAAYKSLQSGEDFTAVARRYSEDPESRNNGGQLAPMPESQLGHTDPATHQAILKLKPGEFTAPIAVVDPRTHKTFGYRIVQLTKKEAAGQRELNDPSVQQWVRNTLRQQKEQVLRSAYDEFLHNGANIHDYYAEEVLQISKKK